MNHLYTLLAFSLLTTNCFSMQQKKEKKQTKNNIPVHDWRPNFVELISLKPQGKRFINGVKLQANNFYLRSTEGIKGLPDINNCWTGDLEDNQLEDLKEVGDIDSFQALYLQKNCLSQVGQLPQYLSILDLRSNRISDLTQIAKLKYLKDLLLDNNEISDLSPLSEMISLSSLAIANNKLTTVKGIPERLAYLWADHNMIETFDGIDDAPNIIWLSLSHNKLTTMPALTGEKMAILNVSNNEIKNIDSGIYLPKLVDLDLSHNKIWNIQPLKNCPSIQYLELYYNELENIEPIKNFKELGILSIGQNRIGSFTVLKIIQDHLRQLSVDKKQLETIKKLNLLPGFKYMIAFDSGIGILAFNHENGNFIFMQPSAYQFAYETFIATLQEKLGQLPGEKIRPIEYLRREEIHPRFKKQILAARNNPKRCEKIIKMVLYLQERKNATEQQQKKKETEGSCIVQ